MTPGRSAEADWKEFGENKGEKTPARRAAVRGRQRSGVRQRLRPIGDRVWKSSCCKNDVRDFRPPTNKPKLNLLALGKRLFALQSFISVTFLWQFCGGGGAASNERYVAQPGRGCESSDRPDVRLMTAIAPRASEVGGRPERTPTKYYGLLPLV